MTGGTVAGHTRIRAIIAPRTHASLRSVEGINEFTETATHNFDHNVTLW